MKIKVTLSFNYEVFPDDYPEKDRTPSKMAELDVKHNLFAILEDGENMIIEDVKQL